MSRTRHHGDTAKMRLYGDMWWWYRSEPRWHRKAHKHKPQRRKAKQCALKALRGGEPLWPLDKKPWVYYW